MVVGWVWTSLSAKQAIFNSLERLTDNAFCTKACCRSLFGRYKLSFGIKIFVLNSSSTVIGLLASAGLSKNSAKFEVTRTKINVGINAGM